MVHIFPKNIKNIQKGITLIELIVAIFIITMFSMIIIADFPRMQRGYQLSAATYEITQDLRTVQGLGLSGTQATDKNGNPIITKGYGVYIGMADGVNTTRYLVYADVDGSETYGGDGVTLCSSVDPSSSYSGVITSDCILKIVDITKDNKNPDLYIKQLNNVNPSFGDSTSINFSPPNPVINIDNLNFGASYVEIVVGLTSDASLTKTILVNKSGLIYVE